MNKHIKCLLIVALYLILCYVIGFDWLYFGVLLILDYFYWYNISWPGTKAKREARKQRSKLKEFGSAIGFAIVGASLIHMFVIQPFIIPTPSMENSLLVGDFLFVSKLHYGPYLPNTPVSIPFMHNTFIGTSDVKPYNEDIQLGYHRLPGFTKVKRNDIVVFNYPQDKLYSFMPFDKKTHYVKRCVAIPGDVILSKDGEVIIENKVSEMPERAKLQSSYLLVSAMNLNSTKFRKQWDLTNASDLQFLTSNAGKNYYRIVLSKEEYSQMQKASYVEEIRRYPSDKDRSELFPVDIKNKAWDVDNFGPITIPAKGMQIELNEKNTQTYASTIEQFEDHTLTWETDRAMLDGKPASTYTFKMDYYWMMGDNRHNSLDSRFWGFVPENHIVGKPVFVFLSFDKTKAFLKKIRWSRLFTTIHGEGKPISFFPYAVIIFLFFRWRKNRRKKAQSKSA